ncbi:Vitamin K epoxide reductase [Streptomyces sp. WAC 06738]|uniref:vitamin K epoxide reductase family protein n=1 Tax=Streptomyces sp. WAC 06738 TaxID=2203210 RepID=UPI000F6F230E|nr:vitamin K epoxide reductase family protein [Streptomyces sp. WAC 06738]AZM44987.1 Vitamin K epoxide reductase [Streptomyces sp. WAC 06738]
MTTTATRTAPSQHEDPPDSGLIGSGRPFAWLLVVGGVLGLVASAVITHDKMKLLEDPGYVSACSLNPVLSCNNIMKSWQASVFGFPNPFVGWIAFPMLVVIGVGLLSGATHRRWWWTGLWAGSLFGVGFVTFLQYSSLYKIGSLCLWCSLVWAVTILIFWYTTVHNVKTGVFPVSARVRETVLEFNWVVPVLWYGILLILIGIRWWSYWKTLL